ncbi:hypothetical protein IWX91DRAFT_169258 [Phyllosticta citricarpa]
MPVALTPCPPSRRARCHCCCRRGCSGRPSGHCSALHVVVLIMPLINKPPLCRLSTPDPLKRAHCAPRRRRSPSSITPSPTPCQVEARDRLSCAARALASFRRRPSIHPPPTYALPVRPCLAGCKRTCASSHHCCPHILAGLSLPCSLGK